MRVLTLRNPSTISRLVGALQTLALLVILISMSMVLGSYLLGGVGIALAVAFAVGAFLASSSASPGLVLSLYRAREIGYHESPTLYQVVSELSERADLASAPRLFLSPARMPNALSVGRADRPLIILTRGILDRLNLRQMTGVLAHEIAHIRNRDLWLLGLADSMRRLIRGLSFVGILVLLFSFPLLLVGGASVPPGLLLLLMGAPMASILVELALSRTREFEADRTAVEMTRDPEGFASALRSLEMSQRSGWGWLLPRRTQTGSRLWRSHPPTEQRIERILNA
jgi:heat shock protein HtpX